MLRTNDNVNNYILKHEIQKQGHENYKNFFIYFFNHSQQTKIIPCFLCAVSLTYNEYISGLQRGINTGFS